MSRFWTFSERPDLLPLMEQGRDPWESMPWMNHDPVCERYWPRLKEEYPQFQFLICDDDDGILGEGWTIPFQWSGHDEELPDGIDGVLPHAFEPKQRANSLSALLAVVYPDRRSRGLSADILRHMRSLAHERGLRCVTAPVRPSLKHRYPLSSMERFVHWRRDDGLPLDPWLRTHERLGARRATICHNSNVFKGTVSQWEEWTGLRLFESGQYLAPGMMNPFTVDVDADAGTYVEPNVWMIHGVPF
jgi:GNAT superfamily N-acetyltransferase